MMARKTRTSRKLSTRSAPKAELFPDRAIQSAVRVEYIDDREGTYEVAIFDGPRALKRARCFAKAFYRIRKEIKLTEYARPRVSRGSSRQLGPGSK
jgi:hypothetical protein